MKKVLTIISVLLWVVLVTGCSQQPVSQTQPTTPTPVVQQPTTQPVVQPTTPTPVVQQPTTQPVVQPTTLDKFAGWHIYTNDKYGVTFKYPGASEFSKVDEYPSSGKINDSNFGSAILEFNLPTKDPEWVAQKLTTFTALRLIIFPKAGADAFNKACEDSYGKGPMFLSCSGKKPFAQNNMYVYYLSNYNQDAPTDAITRVQLDQILSTFQFTK